MTRALLVLVALLLASHARAFELSYALEGTGFDDGELTLDFDANGDGINGDVTVVSAWLTSTKIVLPPILVRDSLGTLADGAAHLAGDSLTWDELPTYSHTYSTYCVPGHEALCLFIEPIGGFPQVTVIDASNGMALSLFDPDTGDPISTWSFSSDLRELRRFGMRFGFVDSDIHYLISGRAVPEPGVTALATLLLVSLGCGQVSRARRRVRRRAARS